MCVYIYYVCMYIQIYIYKENTDVNIQKEHVSCMPSNLGLWRHRLGVHMKAISSESLGNSRGIEKPHCSYCHRHPAETAYRIA